MARFQGLRIRSMGGCKVKKKQNSKKDKTILRRKEKAHVSSKERYPSPNGTLV